MAPVIPMNAKTTRFTDLGRYYLLYTCPFCGTPGLSEQQLRKEEERHFLRLEHMSNPELDKASPKAEATDTERSRAADDMAKRLSEGDFSPIAAKVLCSRCGKIQPWSGLGKPWHRTILAFLTAVVTVATLICLRGVAWSVKWSGKLPLLFLPLGLLVLASVWYIFYRRGRLFALRSRGGDDRPVYCTAAALRDHADGPWKDLVKPYLKKEK